MGGGGSRGRWWWEWGGGPDRVEAHQDGAAGEERWAPEENIDIRVGVAGRRAAPPLTTPHPLPNTTTPPTSLREWCEM